MYHRGGEDGKTTIQIEMKGSYILLVQLPEEQVIKAGSVLDNYFPSGYYAYVV